MLMAGNGRLNGLRAVITGGSAGIGEAAAQAFAREGAAVAVVGRDLSECKRVCETIEAAGGSAMALSADVTRAADIERMVQAVASRWGTIDVLVNCAGGWNQLAPVTDMTEDEWDRIMAVNLKSVFLCVRAVAPIMIEKKKGRIVNVGSMSGTMPGSGTNSNLAYATAKGGVIVLTRHLAKQLGPHGITVNTVSPGTTLTPRVRKVWDADTVAKKAAGNPLRRLVEPEDSANAIVFLASDEARHITGVNLNVNAGSLMW
jgi:3-oxoacyl-[acyl-carrier protein] reductase